MLLCEIAWAYSVLWSEPQRETSSAVPFSSKAHSVQATKSPQSKAVDELGSVYVVRTTQPIAEATNILKVVLAKLSERNYREPIALIGHDVVRTGGEAA